MILNTHLPVKAWLDPKTSRLPGVQPVAINDWLQRSDTFDAQIKYRRDLVARKRETVFQTTPDSEAACTELRDIIHAETPQDWTWFDHPLQEAAVNTHSDPIQFSVGKCTSCLDHYIFSAVLHSCLLDRRHSPWLKSSLQHAAFPI